MPDKPYFTMGDDELRDALAEWEQHVESAGGWASAHFAAQQVAIIVREGNSRGLGFINNHPIKVG